MPKSWNCFGYYIPFALREINFAFWPFVVVLGFVVSWVIQVCCGNWTSHHRRVAFFQIIFVESVCMSRHSSSAWIICAGYIPTATHETMFWSIASFHPANLPSALCHTVQALTLMLNSLSDCPGRTVCGVTVTRKDKYSCLRRDDRNAQIVCSSSSWYCFCHVLLQVRSTTDC